MDQPSRAVVDATGVGGFGSAKTSESPASAATPGAVGAASAPGSPWCSAPGCWPVGGDSPGPEREPEAEEVADGRRHQVRPAQRRQAEVGVGRRPERGR
jgi:hypothetical protein